jgi:hypothetical protein
MKSISDPMARVAEGLDDGGPLFAPPAPIQIPVHRAHGPMAPESLEAAKTDRTADERMVLAELARGPKTADEVAASRNMAPNQISGRFTKLWKDGLIERTGQRRPTRTGSAAAVWRVTGQGDTETR